MGENYVGFKNSLNLNATKLRFIMPGAFQRNLPAIIAIAIGTALRILIAI